MVKTKGLAEYLSFSIVANKTTIADRGEERSFDSGHGRLIADDPSPAQESA
jgi:hypothetical protein